MAINVVFTFLMIVVREARNQKRVPQVGSVRKETVRVGVSVASW